MSTLFSSKQRMDLLKELENAPLDLLVIGGGITGAGIALDAQSRGISTGLVEMQDFAAGTSSRSTKLVHGGLRYLKQFEIKLVAEVGKERAIVYENGPHVTTPEWMILPIYENGTFGKFSTSIGLRLYDYLAGVKKSERRKMLTVKETLDREPLLKKKGLKGSGYYVEYRTDDARLTIEVLKEAVKTGTKAVNYAKVEKLIYKDGKATGVQVIDQLTNQSYTIYAKKIVNAAGPWVDSLREMDQSKQGKSLLLTKGVHLVIDQSKFPLQQAIYFDTPDGRMMFAIPRDGKAYVGTTDTVYEGNIVNPTMSHKDREYILSAIQGMFPEINITEKDVESSWAGLRPLIREEGKNTSEISRKDEIWQSESGLITIAGGKLTGYRKMSEIAVNLVASLLKREGYSPYKQCVTKGMPISGGSMGGSAAFPAFIERQSKLGTSYGFTREESKQLVRMYGSNIDRIYDYARRYGNKSDAYGLPQTLFVRLVYSIYEEMAAKPADFFIRRTGALFFNIDLVKAYKSKVIAFMAEELGWTEEQISKYTRELEQLLQQAVEPDTV